MTIANRPTRVFLVAAEPSGDAVAADLITALRAHQPDMMFAGMGGPKMAALGIKSCTSIDGLSILGLTEALAIWKLVREKVKAVGQAAVAFQPDVVVLIDSWGFTIRAAQEIRALLPGIPLVKMIGPQVFATRPGRAKSVAKNYDALFCIHDFEMPFYEGLDIPITVIGNPAVARIKKGDGEGFVARHNLSDRKLALLLPGSRRAEIALVSPTFEEAAKRLSDAFPALTFVTVIAPAVEELVRSRAQHWHFPHILVAEDEKEDAFAAADIALACSGTVTTEVALQGTPMIVGYRLGAMTAFIILNFMLKSRFVTLVNIALDQPIVPEFIQNTFTPEAVVAAATALLTDPAAHARQVKLLDQALSKMGRDDPPMAQRAAAALLKLIEEWSVQTKASTLSLT
jgi:lipid-A-disaccharide synthase